ncbi:DNA helicase [Microbacterium sp. W1N]|uniref:DNA helicase n=1 Tax=Microbacterium festucae TaxID=2977531 RepID=UPI0021BFD9D7|nr:DNA helicase [Microbacterium festucae]MCT9819456.1 DNA helicase [Microbacterium festucae]
MSLSRKRKKELRKLQKDANTLWESQQVLLGQAGDVAREAGRQLSHYNREQVVPAVHEKYDTYAAPYVNQGVAASKRIYNRQLVPAAGALVGSALSVWDAANETRGRIASGRGVAPVDVAKLQKKAKKYGAAASKKLSVVENPKSGIGAGGVIALILGIAAAAGVLYAAWQTLRADDELWVADDPLRAPDA